MDGGSNITPGLVGAEEAFPGASVVGTASAPWYSGLWQSIQSDPGTWLRAGGAIASGMGMPGAGIPLSVLGGGWDVLSAGEKEKEFAEASRKKRKGEPLSAKEEMVLARGAPKGTGAVAVESAGQIHQMRRQAEQAEAERRKALFQPPVLRIPELMRSVPGGAVLRYPNRAGQPRTDLIMQLLAQRQLFGR